METQTKRSADESDVENIQEKNRQWWTDHTMSYDWKDKVTKERFTDEWFDEIDRRFIYGSRLFAHDKRPFDRIIPFKAIAGRDVLEIGCGMGFHTELMVRAGARISSVDISETSIAATNRRLELRGLQGDVKRMDARALEFPEASFDFVWSWGVIHHSAQTAVIIREIARVLRPRGEMRIMVYNLDGMSAYYSIIRSYLFGFWHGRSIDEGLWKRADEFMARHYTKDMLSDIARLFFSKIKIETFGQYADGVPLPSQIRPLIIAMMGQAALAKRSNAHGSFLFLTAGK